MVETPTGPKSTPCHATSRGSPDAHSARDARGPPQRARKGRDRGRLPRVEERRTEGAQEKAYVTVGEAAKLLGVHRNTVHNWIRSGRLTAHKVVESNREFYRIERDSLPVGRPRADVRTLDAQGTSAATELVEILSRRIEEIVQGYGRELGAVKEELGAERVRREQAERKRDELAAKLATLQEAQDTPQTDAEEPEGAEPRPATEEAQEGAQPRSWWRRFFGFE
jgi:excisionase family DNA binding protein